MQGGLPLEEYMISSIVGEDRGESGVLGFRELTTFWDRFFFFLIVFQAEILEDVKLVLDVELDDSLSK